jgi:hypothetical protein
MARACFRLCVFPCPRDQQARARSAKPAADFAGISLSSCTPTAFGLLPSAMAGLVAALRLLIVNARVSQASLDLSEEPDARSVIF